MQHRKYLVREIADKRQNDLVTLKYNFFRNFVIEYLLLYYLLLRSPWYCCRKKHATPLLSMARAHKRLSVNLRMGISTNRKS